MLPIEILLEAKKAVPSLKYALGVAGIGAVVAIILGFGLDPKIALFGILIVIICMFLLVVFSNFAKSSGKSAIILANFLAWSFTLITITTASFLMSSFFFNYPKPPSELFPREIDNSPLVINPVIDLSRPIHEQLQLYPTDVVTVYGTKPTLKEVWFGNDWEPFEYDRKYMVRGTPNKPVIPIFEGSGTFKIKVEITNYKDKKRKL